MHAAVVIAEKLDGASCKPDREFRLAKKRKQYLMFRFNHCFA
jgi:hypothetical protein